MCPDIEQRERFRDPPPPFRPDLLRKGEEERERGTWLIGGTKDAGNGFRVSGNRNGIARAIQPTFSEGKKGGNSARGFVFPDGVNFLGVVGVGMVRRGMTRIIIELYGG